MMYVTTLDVMGLTPFEYRAVLDKMGVERRPAKNIFLHVTTPIEGGYRILEIWDSQEGFEEFLKNRLGPANEELGLERATTVRRGSSTRIRSPPTESAHPGHSRWAPTRAARTGRPVRFPRRADHGGPRCASTDF